jgi:16S rRNA (guanine527-N7)-methyltransferase
MGELFFFTMAGRTHIDLLGEAFRAIGRPEPACAPALAAFLDELALWSERSSLTGLSTPRERVENGVLDALPLADAAAQGGRLVDVGSGNGLPGLVVAVMRPDLRVSLMEPSARRAAFLRSAASAASAGNVEVIRSRVQDWEGDPFDAAVARAVFPVAEWLRIGRGLVGDGGIVYALAGGDAESVDARGLRLERTHGYDLPWSGSRRTLFEYSRL